MRIFVGLTEVAGYYSGLTRGFSDLGIKATYVSLTDHPFKYIGGETSNLLIELVKYSGRRRGATSNSNLLLRGWWVLIYRISMGLFFSWAALTHDAFIFGYKTTFFNFKELFVLKLLRRKIIYVFHGSDSRPPYIDGAVMTVEGGPTIDECIELAAQQKKQIRMLERYTDVIVSHPLFAHFHERKMVSFLRIGIPYDFPPPKEQNNVEPERRSATRILHCPSHPEAKGTPLIREAISNLKAKGYAIDFVEIIGRPNSVVREEITKCDFVIDQVYSDTPLAGFATEAAFLGKAAVVCGYGLATHEGSFVPRGVPLNHCRHPDDLERAIENLIVDRDYCVRLGRSAGEYVSEHWTPPKVARRFVQLIEGDIPVEWLLDPNDIRYMQGACIPEERARSLVRKVIEKGGREALQASDKPELEALFVKFAFGETANEDAKISA